MQYRAHKAKIITTRAEGDKAGVVEAIVSAYGIVDTWGTRFNLGAFRDYDKVNNPDPDDLPRVVWGHDWNRFVGKVTETEEMQPGDKALPEASREQGGWFVRSEFALETIDGGDLFKHMDFGSVNKWSHGFEPLEETRGDDGITGFDRVKVYEVSPVLVPANGAAQTLGTRGRSEFESMTVIEKMESLIAAYESLERHLTSYADMRSRNERGVSEEIVRKQRALAGATRRLDALLGTVTVQGDPKRIAVARNLLREANNELTRKGIYHG